MLSQQPLLSKLLSPSNQIDPQCEFRSKRALTAPAVLLTTSKRLEKVTETLVVKVALSTTNGLSKKTGAHILIPHILTETKYRHANERLSRLQVHFLSHKERSQAGKEKQHLSKIL